MIHRIGLLFILLIANDANLAWSSDEVVPMVLVIAFDGFRWDYVNKFRTPYLWTIANEGVWAPNGVKNQFPTITLPNFYSAVTGLRPDRHGIVGHIMYDPVLNDTFDYFNEQNQKLIDSARDSKWYSGYPIWQANEDAGPNRRSGLMRFPLGDAKVNNRTAFKYEPVRYYDVSVQWQNDFDTLIDWFTDPKEPINFGIMYVMQPDSSQHDDDIHSNSVTRAINDVDLFVDYTQRVLSQRTLRDKINVLYISDHGHANVYKTWNTIFFDQVIDPKLYRWSGQSIFPNNNVSVDFLYAKVKELHDDQPKFNFWLKDNVPNHLYYKNTPRIGPIVITEHLGYSIASHGETAALLPAVRGSHGFSNEYREMWPMFVAYGPSFKNNYVLKSVIETVDYYNIMCELLQVECAPNDGDFDSGKQILKNVVSKRRKWLEKSAQTSNNSNVSAVLFFVTFCLFVLLNS